jgi:serine/threonine protein kinase
VRITPFSVSVSAVPYPSPSLQHPPSKGDLLADKYRIERVLGRGGMGTVFLAENQVTGKRVAIKWLDASSADDLARARFLREARAAGQVNHPHVVDVYDVAEHLGSPFMVMEYLRGETLQQVLDRQRSLPAELCVEWLLPAMEGVAAAHALGIVHRDLKPDNIFLCERPDGSIHPKVLDFGVAKISSPTELRSSAIHARSGSSRTSSPDIDPSLTRPGALVGSPCYMAIEQIDTCEVDARADVYAFGVILYRAIAGELPYTSTSLSKLIAEIATGLPRPLRDLHGNLPAGLDAVVAKAMARDRAQRYESIDALKTALLPYRESLYRHPSSEISGVRSRTRGERPEVPKRPNLGFGAFLAGAAMLLVGVTAWLVLTSRPERVERAAAEAPGATARRAQPTFEPALQRLGAVDVKPDPRGSIPLAAEAGPGAPPVPNLRSTSSGSSKRGPTSQDDRAGEEPSKRPKRIRSTTSYEPELL